ncbi:MAG: endonuclease/exonuclease/phosphatase family protein [Ruminococcaceae bacterium]|nr:endonuclease/exonuclease/phosphatase family protein [Oscillospiraceae bacterium]
MRLYKGFKMDVIIFFGVILFLLLALFLFLVLTEYKPADREPVQIYAFKEDLPAVQAGQTVTLYTWNIGYAGLGKESDFFMDGGNMVDPPSQQIIEKNMDGIREFVRSQEADIWLLQEVDKNSARTNGMDQYIKVHSIVNGAAAFAYNYKAPFVPYPIPPLDRVESGIATFSNLLLDKNMERISLPCPFAWPIRVAQIKRCLLVTRTPVEGTDKELVTVNLHLEAYDDGEGKAAQTKVLMDFLQEEYNKGNYVIAGGDFNQTFPGALDQYPIQDTKKWTPGTLTQSSLPEGWQFAYDTSAPTCRLLDKPYKNNCQLYVIDGFILSPNVKLEAVETQDLNFECSDHNPVRLEVTLIP